MVRSESLTQGALLDWHLCHLVPVRKFLAMASGRFVKGCWETLPALGIARDECHLIPK